MCILFFGIIGKCFLPRPKARSQRTTRTSARNSPAKSAAPARSIFGRPSTPRRSNATTRGCGLCTAKTNAPAAFGHRNSLGHVPPLRPRLRFAAPFVGALESKARRSRVWPCFGHGRFLPAFTHTDYARERSQSPNRFGTHRGRFLHPRVRPRETRPSASCTSRGRRNGLGLCGQRRGRSPVGEVRRMPPIRG